MNMNMADSEDDVSNVLVSHIDLDGYGCNIILGHFVEFVAEYNVNYTELAETLNNIPKNVRLFITDLSVPKSLAGLLNKFKQVVLIDHHVSTEWAIDYAKCRPNWFVVVDKSHCATWHCWDQICKYAENDEYMSNWLEECAEDGWGISDWARVVNDYDMWEFKYPEESRRLNALLYSSNRKKFVAEGRAYSVEKVLSCNKERIDSYLKNQAEYIASTPMMNLPDELGGWNIVVAFAERYRSHIGAKAIEDGADLVYIISMKEMQISIRSSEESHIDCSQIAAVLDASGGGHHNAAGCSIHVPDYDGLIGFLRCLPTRNLPIYSDEE